MKKNSFIILLILLLLGSLRVVSQTWQELNSGTDYILFDLSFAPGQNDVGYAAGMQYTYDANGIVIKTTDGGESWTTILGGPGESQDGIEAVAFITPEVGFIAGWNDYFAKTTDGGTTWVPMTVGANNWYFMDLEFWDANNGIACARLNSGGNAIYVTDDGGSTWTTATGLNQGVEDVAYANSSTLYAVGGDEKISKSTNGGISWAVIYSGTPMYYFMGVDFYNDFGVVGGEDGKRFSTTDGGSNWSNSATGYENFKAVHVFNSDSAYIGGTDAHIYKTINSGSSWSSEFGGNGTSALYKIKYTENGTGFACGSQGYLIRKAVPLMADFTADNTTICIADNVNFTDLSTGAISWEWTFEGGTPSSSTEQNPSVSYDIPGTYDVSLTVSNGSWTATEIKSDYISVFDTPDQAEIPTGDQDVCSGNTYTYTTAEVPDAEDYNWELDPSDAGSLTHINNQAFLTVDDAWAGDFGIRVQASNFCGDGEWSDYLYGTVHTSPAGFNVTGGGTYCDGGEGMEIGLDGSETDTDYELYFNNDPTGNIVSGTGSAISFGMQTEEGTYTVMAVASVCSSLMEGEAQVTINYIPEAPGVPEGDLQVCNNTVSDYTTSGSSYADFYTWTLLPEDAGVVTEDNLHATVAWNSDFSGSASLSVIGSNDCGTSDASSVDVVVEVSPEPLIAGQNLVCDNSSEMYSTADNEGNSYTWNVTGGEIVSGQGTSIIIVMWGEPGTGTVEVTEETAAGCAETTDIFEVTIDDCTGIHSPEKSDEMIIYPNPSQKMLNVNLNTSLKGSADALILDRTGQIVINQVIELTGGEQSLRFNISHLPNGIYILKIKSNQDQHVLSKKFIKK